MAIDAPRLMAETLIISLKCVDSLLARELRAVIFSIFAVICGKFKGYVDLRAETLLGYRLYGELPTDGFKSD